MDGNILLLAPILVPILMSLFIKILNIKDMKRIKLLVSITVIINFVILIGIFNLGNISLRILNFNSLNKTMSLFFKIDDISKIFTTLTSVLWILVSFYAFEYMGHEENQDRFFIFFTMTLGIVIGIGCSGNMLTFYLFYELMTLITFPLVIHSQSDEAFAAGKKYLIYSFLGAAFLLIGIFFAYYYGKGFDFRPGGILDINLVQGQKNTLLLIYIITFIGFGSKAGMFPLHAWLPSAHPVAPTPASGLLSGIITKCGVLGIIRMTYYVFGASFISGTWAQDLIQILIIFTIFMGSMLAYRTNHLKTRLAYSSVSQVSYVLFGLMLLNIDGFIGGILHLIFHGIIKNVLFLSVGTIINKLNKNHDYELKGIGKYMPFIMWCFTFASLALIGIPPLSGIVSKWYLGIGGLSYWNHTLGFVGVIVLLISSLLTAGYLIPVIADGFFPGEGFDYLKVKKLDPSIYMKGPLLILTVLLVLLGIFPSRLVLFIKNIGEVLL